VFTGLSLGVAALAGLGVAVLTMAISFTPAGRALRTPLPPRHDKPREEQFWFRWSRYIQRRPWPAFIGGAAVLIVLALPLFSIRMGFGDTGNLPEEQTARRAYDLLADGFGPGSSGPLVLVSTDPAADAGSVARVDAALSGDAAIAFASPGAEIAPGTWLWQAYPISSPQDEAITQLVERLRDDALPATGIAVMIGGFTAGSIDFSSYLGDRLPLLIGAVLVLSFLLLMLVFRSVLVPLKAVIMNLLSVGAAYGVVVAIFQWGWAKDLFGIGKAGPVEAWAPMMLFAIVFGLSMDYEVFLLSRMREEFVRTGDNHIAVADGLAATARVITAAALIMVCVFGAFVLGNDRQLKLFGLGMAVAVAVDATIVRMILVPATMELLGSRNWWMPAWLDRILPRIEVEGHHPEADAAALDDGDDDDRPLGDREPQLV
jgi:RND superfamily putative drug exporter